MPTSDSRLVGQGQLGEVSKPAASKAACVTQVLIHMSCAAMPQARGALSGCPPGLWNYEINSVCCGAYISLDHLTSWIAHKGARKQAGVNLTRSRPPVADPPGIQSTT